LLVVTEIAVTIIHISTSTRRLFDCTLFPLWFILRALDLKSNLEVYPQWLLQEDLKIEVVYRSRFC